MRTLLAKRDGHIHTSFCPHGTKDSIEMYVEKAIEEGREEITFTEHFPMPDGVTEDWFKSECAMGIDSIENYKLAVENVKNTYSNRIKINYGFEIDYIEGFEETIMSMLDEHAREMEDGIISVHFVKYNDEYYAIDYLPDFEKLLAKTNSIEKIYDIYYETLLKSIRANLGEYKPTRIGHPSLVRIFNKKYPTDYYNQELLNEIAKEIKDKNYSVDFNMAGIRKPLCNETYPSGKWLELIKSYGVDLVMGSDSHSASQIKIDSSYGETK